MYYLMITAAAAFFSLQFMFNSNFQKENGSGLDSALNFSIYSSVIGIILMLVLNKFKFEFSFFSFFMSMLMAIISISFSYSSVKVLKNGSLSMYSMYSMLGGMLIPFLYGVTAGGEELKILRVLCCILMAFALSLTVKKEKTKTGAVKYYVMVFVLNGLTATFQGIHQSNAMAVDSESFLILSRFMTVVLCAGMKFVLKDYHYKINLKSVVYSGGYSLFNCMGQLFLLIALLHLPVSVQYPIVTGGTIVFATIISAVRRENINVKDIVAAGIALGASTLMAL